MRNLYSVVGIVLAAGAGSIAGYEFAYSEMRSSSRISSQEANNTPSAIASPKASSNEKPTEVATAEPSPTPSPSPPPRPEWIVNEEKNPLDDSQEVSLSMLNEGDIYNKFGMRTGAFLIIRCKDNRTEVIFGTDEFFGTMDDVAISYRIDDKPAVSTSWSVSTNGKAVFAPQAVAFAKSLAAGQSIFVRIDGNYGAKVEAKFPLIGLSDHLPKVSSACGWKP